MESDYKMFETLCRLCLSNENSNNLVSLIKNDSANGLSAYGISVKKFAEISIEKDDKLPKNMCLKCLYLLKCAIYFKLKCESSEKVLKQRISSSVTKRHKKLNLDKKNDQYSSSMQNFSDKKQKNTSRFIHSPKVTAKCTENLQNFDESDESNNDDIFQAETQDPAIKMTQDDNCDILDIMENNSKVMLKGATKPKSNINKSLHKNCQISVNVQNDESNESYNDIFQSNVQDSIMNITQDDSSDILDVMENDPNVMPKSTSKIKTIKKSLHKKYPLSILKKDNFECEICKKVLANPITYEQHMQYHTGCKYICDQCGKGFPALSRLQVHQVTIHGTGPYLTCQYCSYKAPKKTSLIEHERLHTGERPYTCDKCGLTFRRRAIWRKHMIYHGSKNVQCTLCPRKFFTIGQMKAHSNSVHERLYMYVCHKCDATYAKTTTVRKHLVEKHGIPKEMQGKITRINRGKRSDVVEP